MACRVVVVVVTTVGLVGLCAAPAAFAQDTTTPTVVQLPTFSFFGVSTTVSVPDSGSVLLGGRPTYSNGSTAFGPPFLRPPFLRPPWPRSRASGGGFAASQSRLGVFIHDFATLDELTLGAAGKLRHADAEAPLAPRSSSTASRPTGSLAEARALRAAEVQREAEKIVQLFAKAVESEERGNALAARGRYRQVARQAQGDLRRRALAKVRELEGDSRPAAKPARKP